MAAPAESSSLSPESLPAAAFSLGLGIEQGPVYCLPGALGFALSVFPGGLSSTGVCDLLWLSPWVGGREGPVVLLRLALS